MEEILGRTYETVVGRLREDLEAYGTKAAGFVGKHIVGTGEDAHLTTKVYLDLLRPHIMLVCGKRGCGKSYDAAIIGEEFLQLSEEFRKRLAMVFIDTMGIFWSFKRSNELQKEILKEWGLEPQAFEDVKVYVPFGQEKEFERAGIPVDGGISIAPYEFTADEWRLAFNLSPTEPAGISLEKNVNELREIKPDFSIETLIAHIREDRETSMDVRHALENMLTVANQWGVFGIKGIDITQLVRPGQLTVVDVSRLRATAAWSVRNLIVAILAREIYRARVMSRKREEVAKLAGEEVEEYFPLTWLIVDEAHNFVPADFATVSTEPLLTIAKQGREPGVSLVVITQMPNKVHPDVLAQCDLVISHRLTSRADLEALHAVAHTYMAEEIWQYLNRLPRTPGSCIIIDDTLEKIYTVQIRPRVSHHAGGTAII